MLDVQAVDTFHGETQALFGASLTLREGDFINAITA